MASRTQVSQIMIGNDIVTKGKRFLKRQHLDRDRLQFTIYILSYGLQDSALISFFEVLPDL